MHGRASWLCSVLGLSTRCITMPACSSQIQGTGSSARSQHGVYRPFFTGQSRRCTKDDSSKRACRCKDTPIYILHLPHGSHHAGEIAGSPCLQGILPKPVVSTAYYDTLLHMPSPHRAVPRLDPAQLGSTLSSSVSKVPYVSTPRLQVPWSSSSAVQS